MTPEEYKAAIDAAGRSPCKPPFQGSTLHKTRDGKFQQVPNPEHLSPDERVEIIAVINAALVDQIREVLSRTRSMFRRVCAAVPSIPATRRRLSHSLTLSLQDPRFAKS
jgi:hypothetical protein